MRQLETLGMSRNRIIDGRVFNVPNLDFPRLVKEGIAYGILENASVKNWGESIYSQSCNVTNRNITVSIGRKSYINGASLLGTGKVSVGNFSPISWGIVFQMSQMFDHNHRNVTSFGLNVFDWRPIPSNFYSPQGTCKILIGSDVWIGSDCVLKCNNPNKPLVICDGAVIASNSVVVKDVPPYAIVGGNPAQIIKYRFPPDIIEALLRIKWWDWSLEKIHDNFKHFNDVEKFTSMYDPIMLKAQ